MNSTGALPLLLNRGRRETDRRDASGLPMQASSAFPTISSVCPFANTKRPSSSVITIGTSAISTTNLRASSEESCGESFICPPTPTGGSAPLIGTALHQYKRDSQPFVPSQFPSPHLLFPCGRKPHHPSHKKAFNPPGRHPLFLWQDAAIMAYSLSGSNGFEICPFIPDA